MAQLVERRAETKALYFTCFLTHMTLNKDFPSTRGWTSLPVFLRDTSAKSVKRQSVKQLCTTPINLDNKAKHAVPPLHRETYGTCKSCEYTHAGSIARCGKARIVLPGNAPRKKRVLWRAASQHAGLINKQFSPKVGVPCIQSLVYPNPAFSVSLNYT